MSLKGITGHFKGRETSLQVLWKHPTSEYKGFRGGGGNHGYGVCGYLYSYNLLVPYFQCLKFVLKDSHSLMYVNCDTKVTEAEQQIQTPHVLLYLELVAEVLYEESSN